MKKVALGIDIGGSHITCQLFNLAKNLPVENSIARLTVDSHSPKEEILGKWTEAIKKAAAGRDLKSFAGIGFAMPGPFDYCEGVAWFKGVQKFDNLYGVDVKNALLKSLGLSSGFPIRFLNDASCFAIGEAWMGEASRYKRIIALTLGTGFGSTFIKNGLPIAGINGIPEDGFLYHIPFKTSVADDYFSTRWFLSTYYQKTGIKLSGVKKLADKTSSDSDAAGLFSAFGKNLGEFLSGWINRFQADCVVMGGNISKSFSLFRQEMEQFLEQEGLDVHIYPSKLDETAALFGSAKLCDDAFYNQLIKAKIF